MSGREVAHIHFDGSIHGVLPHSRIPEAEAAGWIERHPFAGVQPGFEAYVLIFHTQVARGGRCHRRLGRRGRGLRD